LRELVEGYPGCHEPTKFKLIYKLGDPIIDDLTTKFRIFDNILVSRLRDLPDELRNDNISWYAFSFEGITEECNVHLRIWAYVEVAKLCGWSIDNDHTELFNELTEEVLEKLHYGGT
jgi:hypothetical protein